MSHDNLPKGMEPPEPEQRPCPAPPGRVVHFDDVGGLIDELGRMFQAGRLRALLVIAADTEENFEVARAGDMSYVEQVGALGVATDLVHCMARGGEAG